MSLRYHDCEPSLFDYYAAHHGNVTDKWSSYLSIYQGFFAPYQQKPIRLLEIGVQNGGSLAIWAQYFHAATAIIGCDINPACGTLHYDDPRICVVIGDANEKKTENLIKYQSEKFDIIIDDGSHVSSDVIKSFSTYFDKLEYGGLYISEDLHCSYWNEFDGGILYLLSSMSFFKRLSDVLNHEHWGLPWARADILRSFEAKYGLQLRESTLSCIHSISFFNSLVVIRKCRPSENTLGRRLVVGDKQAVWSIIEQNGSLSIAPDQSANAWSARKLLPEDELEQLREEKRLLTSKIKDLQNANKQLLCECRLHKEAYLKINQKSERFEREVLAIRSSTSWKVTSPLRLAMRILKRQVWRARILCRAMLPGAGQEETRRALIASLQRRLGKRPTGVAPPTVTVPDYATWSRRFDTPTSSDLAFLEASAGKLPHAAVILVLTSESARLAERTIDALKGSIGIVFSVLPDLRGCSPSERARVEMLLKKSGLSRLDGPEEIASQAPLIVLEGGAIPRAHALRIMADALTGPEAPAIVYSDEDMLDGAGAPVSPWFKPTFSPHLAEAGLLLGRMVGLGGVAAGQVRDALAAPEAGLAATVRACALTLGARQVARIPHVLYHNALALPPPLPVVRPLPDPLPSVSILIPTRNGWNFLAPCLASLKTTDWPGTGIEIIVIDNGSDDEPTLRGLAAAEAAGEIRVLRDDAPFNFARLNNAAARMARGEFLVLLNNDTTVRDRGWLRALIAEAAAPGAGAIGAKLLYPDGTVQHGGVVLGIQGCCSHSFVHLGAGDGGYRGLANVTREQSAVTGACLAVRRDLFFSVGGLDENFRVAFNDTMLCLDILQSGHDNVIIADPLLTHHESKTRGYDDTPEKVALWRHETNLAWDKHAALLRQDPFYSPNLSLEVPYALSPAPRRRPAWRPCDRKKLRVMLLSCTHARGHGVAVVIDQQVRALAAAGHEVILAGERSPRDFDYGGRPVVEVHDPRAAAAVAAERGVDVIVAQTPPFFSVAIWAAAFPPVIVLDHGEPPAELFADAPARREVNATKAHAFHAAARVLAISRAVASECPVPPDNIVPNANSHLGKWGPDQAALRATVRRARGWQDRIVVLTVCRFHAAERAYKGVDTYTDLTFLLARLDPALARRTVFVLCGKGEPADIAEMEAEGLVVAANVSDAEMAGLYAAADVYASFSQWEGYNLGIGQALAMGLPVIASDIPAHRAFGVEIAEDSIEAVFILRKIVANPPKRASRVTEWDDVLPLFVREVEGVAMGELGRNTHAASG